MGTLYASQAIANYNDDAPPDDGSKTSLNQLSWAKHISEIGNPIKAYVDSVNTALVNYVDIVPNAKATDYTTVADDHNRVIETTATTTITLAAVAIGAGYKVTIKNAGTGIVTVDATGTETIDGSTTAREIGPLQSETYQINAAGTGYFTLNRQDDRRVIDVVKMLGVSNTFGADIDALVQAAIDDLTALTAGGVVYFPPGQYRSDAGLEIKANVAIKGAGRYYSQIYANNNSMDVISFTQTADATANFFHVEGLAIGSNNKTGVKLIDLYGKDTTYRLSGLTLRDLYLTGSTNNASYGIDLGYCANTDVSHVYMIQCATGIRLNICADTDLEMMKVQLGTGVGFQVVGDGTPSGRTTAADEGLRITNCSTNGQAQGLEATGADFGKVSASSFTTAPNGPAVLTNCWHWSFSATEFAETTYQSTVLNQAGLNLDSNCYNVKATGCYFGLNDFGIDAEGTDHTFSDNFFEGSDDTDVSISGSGIGVMDNRCASTGASFSIVEQAGSDNNIVDGNRCSKTIVYNGGSATIQGNNLENI